MACRLVSWVALMNIPRLAFAGLSLIFCIAASPAHAAAVVEVGAPVTLSAGPGTALPPDIALDPQGGINVLWVQKAPPPENGEAAGGANHAASDELVYRRSAAGALEFGAPVRVNSVTGEVWGFAVSKPELAIGADGVIHVLFPANATQAGSGKGILAARYTRSTDSGRSFEPARTLNSAAPNDLSAVMHGGFAAAHAFGTIVAAGASDVHAYWIDTRYMQAEDTAGAIFTADSRDSGRTFSADRPIYRGEVCPCCQLAGAAQGQTVWLADRTVFAGGTRDSAVARSDDAGQTFGAPARVGEARWQIEGCPLKRTVVAVDGDRVYTAWFTAGLQPAGVFFSRSPDGGRSFLPALALHPDAAVSDAPTLAAAAGGTVLVAWHAKAGGERRVFMRLSTDHGASFGPVTEVPAPPGAAVYPEVVLAPGGRGGYLAWQQGQAAVVARVTIREPAAPAARAR